MQRELEALEQRMAQVRIAVREAVRAGDAVEARRLRASMRELDDRWDALLSDETDGTSANATSAGHVPHAARESSIPLREQVYQALTLLGAPAAPKLISQLHEAFFAEPIPATKLASLRRDEAKSFTATPYGRPYYICAALAFDRLVPARGLLAVSTWPLERRVVGPLGPRVDFLTHTTRIAEQIDRMRALGHEPADAALRLLRRFARNVPGATEDAFSDPDPARVIEAARAETAVHADADTAHRQAAARRATARLDDAERLFGAARLAVVDTGDASG